MIGSEALRYAGFWRRFGAYWLDFLVLLPLVGINRWGVAHWRTWWVYSLMPQIAISAFYGIYLVRRFGATPGKLMAGLQIRTVAGRPIGYRGAILRYAPELLLSIPFYAGLAIASLGLTDAEYFARESYHDRMNLLRDLSASWVHYFTLAGSAWVWSEFIIMMMNEKRRAPHDFIAGTVVVVVSERWFPNQLFQRGKRV